MSPDLLTTPINEPYPLSEAKIKVVQIDPDCVEVGDVGHFRDLKLLTSGQMPLSKCPSVLSVPLQYVQQAQAIRARTFELDRELTSGLFQSGNLLYLPKEPNDQGSRYISNVEIQYGSMPLEVVGAESILPTHSHPDFTKALKIYGKPIEGMTNVEVTLMQNLPHINDLSYLMTDIPGSVDFLRTNAMGVIGPAVSFAVFRTADSPARFTEDKFNRSPRIAFMESLIISVFKEGVVHNRYEQYIQEFVETCEACKFAVYVLTPEGESYQRLDGVALTTPYLKELFTSGQLPPKESFQISTPRKASFEWLNKFFKKQ